MGNGSQPYGQLGNGTTNDTSQPISVASNVVAVAGGAYHSLFVTTDGKLWAMGRNNYGQLGNGTANDAHLPFNVSSNVGAVAAAGFGNFPAANANETKLSSNVLSANCAKNLALRPKSAHYLKKFRTPTPKRPFT